MFLFVFNSHFVVSVLSANFNPYPRPIFHVMVLFVEEPVSVVRQLERGKKAVAYNSRLLILLRFSCLTMQQF